MDYFPKRIICLTEETTETLYLLGEQERIVGISGFTVRPAQARKEKPVVSAFTDANIEKIVSLQPDLVIGFSDIQAGIAQQLIARGITVWINNQRTVAGIYAMIIQLGSLVGKTDDATKLVSRYQAIIEQIKQTGDSFTTKPKVYFEEWYDPLISGIGWVSELVELAGGIDIFHEYQPGSLARDRIISNPDEVIQRNPDIIIASWCGKKFKKEKLINRPGWDKISAVKNDAIVEIRSSEILQPGPAALTAGIQQIASIIQKWHTNQF
ncbi:MAG: cobalamin-binding protein [Chitinophagaceae bacterium]